MSEANHNLIRLLDEPGGHRGSLLYKANIFWGWKGNEGCGRCAIFLRRAEALPYFRVKIVRLYHRISKAPIVKWVTGC